MQFTSTTTSISIINQTSNPLTEFTLLCRKQDVPVSKIFPEKYCLFISHVGLLTSAKILALKCIKHLSRQMSAVNIPASNLASILTQMINTHHLPPSQSYALCIQRIVCLKQIVPFRLAPPYSNLIFQDKSIARSFHL